jgi:uncharacterized membrane protein YqgA involved in biofilm formation
MGIVLNAVVILIGGLFGNKLQKVNAIPTNTTLGIGIIIVSLVSFIENMYNVEGGRISSSSLLVILFAFIIGNKIGEVLRIESWLSNCSKTNSRSFNAFIDTTLFFSVGGLQISGPIALALNGDNSQLIIKCIIDIPFAIIFGATYGKITALSALPVAAIQVLIAIITWLSAAFFTPEMISQLCAFGYIILFFSGFNLLMKESSKINNINMLPGIFLIIIFNVFKDVVERIL